MTCLPVAMSRTCRVLSQPATKVRPAATVGEPLTGPCVLYFHFSLPSFVRQYSVSS